MAVDPTLTLYTTFDLLSWSEEGSLELSPKFQRRDVWKPAARAYLMDTLLRGYPVPPIHVRLAQKSIGKGIVREIIDGQQRLRSLFSFLQDDYRLSTSLTAPWSGKLFSQLSDDDRQRLMFTKFHIYQYQGLDDAEALEIFARINTYSVAMNAQELRNGKYFGHFKTTVYDLGLAYLNFWRSHRIFTESAIARMSEAELVSELLIMQMDGLQDKKTSIDEFYNHLDEDWPTHGEQWRTRTQSRPAEWLSRKESEQRFNSVMTEIAEGAGEAVRSSAFRRVPLFYSLYGAVYHRMYGLPGLRLQTPLKSLSANKRRELSSAIQNLSEILSETSVSDAELLPGSQRDFVIAASRQTDNVGPRRRRLETVWRQAKLGNE